MENFLYVLAIYIHKNGILGVEIFENDTIIV